MSAFANSPAAAPPAPEGKQPQPVLSPIPKKPSRAKWWIAAVVVIGAGAALMLRPAAQTKQSGPVISVRTAKVGNGTLTRTLRVAGSTSARNFANVVAP